MGVGGINFSGLSSGIDTNSIIQGLLAVEKQPETLINNDIARLQQRENAYNTVSASLLNLQASASTLDSLRAFNLVTANSSDTTVATVTAQTGAQTGTHTVSVTKLAQAQLVSSAAQSSQTAPLGFTGQFLVNGKSVAVGASDNLQTVAANINAAQAGVTASIISPSAGQFYLTLGSVNTGVQGKISLADTGGSNFLATTLGVFDSSAASVSHPLTGTGAGSALFSDSATSVGTLEGLTAPAVGSNVQIAGTTVSIDLNRSLSQIAGDINAAVIPGVTASVVSVTDPLTSTTKQQLQINGTTSFVDDKNALADLGVVNRNLAGGRELIVARDATFTLDGLAATRATNSFSDAISGVTISLLKDGAVGAPATATIGVSTDTATIKSNINAFVTAFNGAVDSVNTQSEYDPQTGKTGPLFGDVTGQSIVDDLVSNTTGTILGLPINLSLLSQAGITLDQGSHLVVDDSQLSSALASNLSGVAKLFQATGTPTDPNVQFVSSTSDTQPSPTTGYAVAITQAATQATVTASGPSLGAGTLAQDETLTFGGPLFGTATTGPLSGKAITLRAGSTVDAVVSQINADPNIGGAITAGKDGVTGKLTLTAKQYGSLSEFAVVSALPGSTPGSIGIGNAILDQRGADVAGTINGEIATGVGQYLTDSQQIIGNSPKGLALGLQLRISATTPGTYGSVGFTQGVADVTKNYVTAQTDVYSGSLTTAVSSIDDNVKSLQSDVADIEARLKDEQAILQQQFTAMETAVAQIKSSSSGLASLGITPSSITSAGSGL